MLASEMSGMCDRIVGFLERHREDLDAQSEPVIRGAPRGDDQHGRRQRDRARLNPPLAIR